MKTTKIIKIAGLAILTLFSAVSCSEYSVLDNLLRATNNINSVSESYATETAVGTVEELAFSDINYEVMELSESTNDLILFNELRLELIGLHEQIIEQRDIIRDYRDSIRNSIETIRENQYMILDDDKTIITEHIQNLKSYRDGLLETRGLAYLRIKELRGSYTRENLPDIMIVFGEVKEVLEYRLETLKFAVLDLEIIDVLLLEYLES
ncbi:hypothetical protein RJI07_00720 [Mycoplasmatota bacterium WC30]